MDKLHKKKLDMMYDVLLLSSLHCKYDSAPCGGVPTFNEYKKVCEKMLETLDTLKPEPLEVEIEQTSSIFKIGYWGTYGWVVLYMSDVKQEAINFCEKHGLNIKQKVE